EEGGWPARRDPELRSRAARQEHAVEQWQDRLEEARDAARRNAQREATWFEDHRDALADGAAARDELDRRAHEQTREAVQAAPYEPGQHITELIGERSSARDVGAWDHAARRIETYHQTHQPDKSHVEPPEHHAPRHQGEDWQQ